MTSNLSRLSKRSVFTSKQLHELQSLVKDQVLQLQQIQERTEIESVDNSRTVTIFEIECKECDVISELTSFAGGDTNNSGTSAKENISHDVSAPAAFKRTLQRLSNEQLGSFYSEILNILEERRWERQALNLSSTHAYAYEIQESTEFSNSPSSITKNLPLNQVQHQRSVMSRS